MKLVRTISFAALALVASVGMAQAQDGYKEKLRDTLSPNGYYSLTIAGAGDMDWYKVGPINDVGSLAVILAGGEGTGDLDIEVWGGDENSPSTQLGGGVSSEAREFSLVDTSEHYWFWVRVYGVGDASGDYSLITAHNLAERASGSMRQTIPPNGSASLYISGEGDEDWYRIGRVEGMGMMTLTLRGDAGTGDLDVLVFGGDEDGPSDFLGAGVGSDANEAVRVSVSEHYWFWVRVFPSGGAFGSYTLASRVGGK
jgi:hypothetical protein